MKKLNDSNREEALNYVVNLYTLLLGEPDYKEAEHLKAVHLKQLRKFTGMFGRVSEGYLVKEAMTIHKNSSEKKMESLELKEKNTILFNNGKRTQASQVVTLEFPEMFQRKKPEVPKDEDEEDVTASIPSTHPTSCPMSSDDEDEDEEDVTASIPSTHPTSCPMSSDDEDEDKDDDDDEYNEDDEDKDDDDEDKDDEDKDDEEEPIPKPSTPSAPKPSTPSSGTSSTKPSTSTTSTSSTSSTSGGATILSEKELVENIKKIKDIEDGLLFPTIESLILSDNLELGTSLQEKLEYLGFDGYDKLKISDTTNTDTLAEDIVNSFMCIDLNNKADVENLEFAIKKVPQLKEWNEFIERIK